MMVREVSLNQCLLDYKGVTYVDETKAAECTYIHIYIVQLALNILLNYIAEESF